MDALVNRTTRGYRQAVLAGVPSEFRSLISDCAALLAGKPSCVRPTVDLKVVDHHDYPLLWASLARAMKDAGYDTQLRCSLILPLAASRHFPDRCPAWLQFSDHITLGRLISPDKPSSDATLTLLPVR